MRKYYKVSCLEVEACDLKEDNGHDVPDQDLVPHFLRNVWLAEFDNAIDDGDPANYPAEDDEENSDDCSNRYRSVDYVISVELRYYERLKNADKA